MIRDNITEIGLVVALFAIVGVGLGLTGYVSLDAANQQFVEGTEGEFARGLGQLFVALLAFQSSVVTFFLGSVVASVGAVGLSGRAASWRESAVVNGMGSFVGFYVMVGIALVLMLAALETGGRGGGSGGSGSVEIGQFIIPVLIAGLPTAFVGFGTGALASGFDITGDFDASDVERVDG